MNLRHAAALALIGWDLIAPPVGSVTSRRNPATGFYDAYSTAPLHTWQVADSYDTAAECRKALDMANLQARQDCPDCSAIAACIATNDPRLKSKSDDHVVIVGDAHR
jgi:hypothetical protein